MITTLRIKKEYTTPLELATKWFSIMSILNNFNLRRMEVSILAFTCLRGDISSKKVDQFCELFNTTPSSVTNCISRLYKKGFLVKQGKTKVNPQLFMDFNNNIIAQFFLCLKS